MSVNIIENSSDLNFALKTIAKDVINSVSNDVMKKLQERIILDVYTADPRPNRYYYNKTGRPTYEFLRAFKFDKIKETVDEITETLFYDYASMRFDPKTFLHGSESLGDLRERLSDLLNVEGFDTENSFGGKMRHPYWKNFIDELFADTHELDYLFSKYLLKYQSISF